MQKQPNPPQLLHGCSSDGNTKACGPPRPARVRLSVKMDSRRKDERAATRLANVGWAQGLVHKVRKGGAAPGERFELRFGLELHLQGLTPTRPFPTGVDGTDVDFRIPGTTPWNVELLCLNESNVVASTRDFVDYGPASVPSEAVATDRRSGKALRGLWDPKNPGAFAQAARERIDVVAFVHEEAFTDTEICEVARLSRNPESEADLAHNPCNWIVARDKTGLRATNALWNLG